MDESYRKLIDGNRRYALEKRYDDPEYFKKMSIGQTPEYLWIGCSDSRVPANEITGTQSGEVFVHRNIANLVIQTDFNALSVIAYAVDVLKVKHIIVCGHYGCGGVRAAMTSNTHGFVDNWLSNIKEVYNKHAAELDLIEDFDKRSDRLTELNVIEQVKNLSKSKVIQKAWRDRSLLVHGWVYGLNSGLIKDLNVMHEDKMDIEPVFRYNV
ncbi:MAG: carbonic anhydrase [Bacteroidota bacterium]|nr:carbonic anhydrase [Bacteroidota bacterium]